MRNQLSNCKAGCDRCAYPCAGVRQAVDLALEGEQRSIHSTASPAIAALPDQQHKLLERFQIAVIDFDWRTGFLDLALLEPDRLVA